MKRQNVIYPKAKTALKALVSMANCMAVIACLGFRDDVAQVAANDVLGRDLQDAAL